MTAHPTTDDPDATGRPRPRRSGRRRILTIVLVLAAGGLAIALASDLTVQRQVAILSAEEDGDVVRLVVATCGAEPTAQVVEQDETTVRARVTASIELLATSGGDCQDVADLRLQKPLGERTLVDDETGQPVTVTVIQR